jgi:hypothetical protein
MKVIAMSLRTTLLALTVAAVGASSACSVEDVPSVPTYERDVRPIMQSRCVRCHGADGMLNSDPLQQDTIHGAPTFGVFTQLDDLPCPKDADGGVIDAGPLTCNFGLLHYATLAVDLFRQRIHGVGSDGKSCGDACRMPPPPSDPLTARQLQVLDAWIAEPSPM